MQHQSIPAKLCYSHIGGKLGQLLFQAFVDKGWIARHKTDDEHYYVTAKGQKAFTELGLDLSTIKKE